MATKGEKERIRERVRGSKGKVAASDQDSAPGGALEDGRNELGSRLLQRASTTFFFARLFGWASTAFSKALYMALQDYSKLPEEEAVRIADDVHDGRC
jgi:hypothetical protein